MPTTTANIRLMKGHNQDSGLAPVINPKKAWTSVVKTAPIGPNMVAETSSQVYVFMNPNGVPLPPVTMASALSAIIAMTPATTPNIMAVIASFPRNFRLAGYINVNKFSG